LFRFFLVWWWYKHINISVLSPRPCWSPAEKIESKQINGALNVSAQPCWGIDGKLYPTDKSSRTTVLLSGMLSTIFLSFLGAVFRLLYIDAKHQDTSWLLESWRYELGCLRKGTTEWRISDTIPRNNFLHTVAYSMFRVKLPQCNAAPKERIEGVTTLKSYIYLITDYNMIT